MTKTFEYLLDTAHNLADQIFPLVDDIDKERALPNEISNEIADKKFFRLLIPKALDGFELDFVNYLKILKVFAQVDGSTAWCVNQNNVFATNSARMPEEIAQTIWKDKRAVVSNGPPDDSAHATIVEGGYKISGRWDFSSGCRHSTWVAALVPIQELCNPSSLSKNSQTHRTMLIPKQNISLIDTWQVNGLRGTGSFSFKATDLFIPNNHTFGPEDAPWIDNPLYHIPTVLLFASGFATVALGLSYSGLREAIKLSSIKTPGKTDILLADTSTTHREIGKAEASWRAAQAFLDNSVLSLWNGAKSKQPLTLHERIQLRLASTHAIRTSAQVIDVAYNLSGSNAIFTKNPIQRRFQDIHAITQQIQGRLTHYDTAGQFLLGQNTSNEMY